MPEDFVVKIGKPKGKYARMAEVPTIDYCSLCWHQTYGSVIDTLTFTVYDKNLLYAVSEGDEVVLERRGDSTIRYFLGIVQKVSIMDAGVGRDVTVIAQDWTTILDRTAIISLFQTSGQTGLDLIKEAFRQAKLPDAIIYDSNDNPIGGGEGMDIDTYTVDDGGISALSFQGTSLNDVIPTHNICLVARHVQTPCI